MIYPLPMAGESWVSREEHMGAAARRVFTRAMRRTRPVVLVSFAATVAVLAVRALRAPAYEAALHFRMEEGEIGGQAVTPRPPRDIRRHVTSVAFSRQRLEAVMRKHHVSEARLARDPVGAVEDFRDGIEVEVSRNYFLFERSDLDEPRTAYVTVKLQGADPERTREILRDLGELILRVQREQRVDRLAEARQAFADELARARADTQALQRSLESERRNRGGGGRAAAIEAAAKFGVLEAATLAAIENELAIERRVAAVAFAREAEDRQLGLSLELFDEHVRVMSRPLGIGGVALGALVVFPLILVLVAAVAGAFDDRVYDAEDLALHRLPVFGAVPRFRGDDAGALASAPPGRAARSPA